MFNCLLIAALLSPTGKGLTSWLSCMRCFIVFLSLFHVVSLVRCGAWLYRFPSVAFFLTSIDLIDWPNWYDCFFTDTAQAIIVATRRGTQVTLNEDSISFSLPVSFTTVSRMQYIYA